MMQKSELRRDVAWYEFLNTPSQLAQTGLLDLVSMSPYYKTLNLSLGHQLLASMNSWLGSPLGTAALYLLIVSIFTIAIYSLSLILTFFLSIKLGRLISTCRTFNWCW